MPGETEEKPSPWTVDSAMAHWDSRFDDLKDLLKERKEYQESAVTAALASANEANAKTERGFKERIDDGNEHRAQLKEQQQSFPTKNELSALSERVSKNELAIKEVTAVKLGSGEQMAKILAAIGAASGIMAILTSLITLFAVSKR